MYPEYQSKLEGAPAAAKAATPPLSKSALSPDRLIAAQSPRDGEVHVLPVQGNVYMLVADGSNITVSIGPDGALVVDSGSAQMSDKVLETLKQLSAKVAAPTAPNRCMGLHCPGAYEWSSPFMNNQIKAANPTLDFDGRYGSTSGSWTTSMFIEAVYRSLMK